MYRVDIEERTDCSEWNKNVSSVPEGSIFQTTYWADYLRGTGYCRPYFCSARDASGCKGVLLFWVEDLSRRIGSCAVIQSVFAPVARRLALSYAYWIYGPILIDKADGHAVLRAMLEGVNGFARRQRVILMRNVGEPVHFERGDGLAGYPDVYRAFGFSRSRRATLFVDLAVDADTAWKRLRKSTRKDVSSCAKHGLTTVLLQKKDLEEYRGVISENVARVSADFPVYYPDENMWDALRQDESRLEVMAVRKDGRIIGGAGILDYNRIICHMTSCQSDESYMSKINVNDLLTWEIMKLGIERRRRIYDLTGIPFEPRGKKEEGLRRFKMKWSEDMRTYDAYDKIYRKPAERMIRMARRII